MYDALMFQQLALVCFIGAGGSAAVVGLASWAVWRRSPEGRKARAKALSDKLAALDEQALKRALDDDRMERAAKRAHLLKEMATRY